MPVTRLTAIIIGTRDDIEAHAAGPDEQGRWRGLITLGPNDYHRILLSTEPEFSSQEAAQARVQEGIQRIREEAEAYLAGRHPVDAIFDEAGIP